MLQSFFPLAIFPEGSLASSVITSVWVGVIVVAFFNLRLGWVLSGLVVPGYLAPLIIAKPWAAVIILIEGVITYFLVWLFSEYLSRWGKWSNFFGRDRFFALLLGSIAVRVVLDGWLLPIIGEMVNNSLGIQFDYRNNLHSFGLIIVALIANQFWKTGFVRGMLPLVVTVALTTLIIRFGLMEFTNFNLGSLSYMYEDIASSMLSSPKAYIILITAAFLASRMNLHYGWDFNGILIPALLALQWYQPSKILISFVEAFVVLGLSVAVLQLPVFRQMTIEGARKLLLFFNVGFLYKIVLGYLLLWWAPNVKITDYFGYGYLLSTLIAIKMHDKDIVARLSRSTLQTSLTAVFFASIVGFALTFVPQLWSWPVLSSQSGATALSIMNDVRLIDRVREDKIAMYSSKIKDSVKVPLPQETELFANGIHALLSYVDKPDAAQLKEALSLLAQVNYRVDQVAGGYLYIRENAPRRGWGSYALNMDKTGTLLIEVPAPLDERGAMEAGTWLFMSMKGHALALAGAGRTANTDGTSDVLLNFRTFYQTFHRVVSQRDVLQVRGYTLERVREMAGLRRDQGQVALPEPSSVLWVKNTLPPGLRLGLLKEMISNFNLEWNQAPFGNLQRETTREGFAELVLNQADLRKLLFKPILAEQGVTLQEHSQRIDGYLQDWLLGSKAEIAESGTNSYVQPKLEELLFLDEEVVTPLLKLIKKEYRQGGWSNAGVEELRAINSTAKVMGYQIIRYRHKESGQDYLVLSEVPSIETRRYWGSYVFRLGAGNGYVVEVPRPGFEINSFEYGVALFESLKANALLIAGANPNANLDKSADVIRPQNKANVFNLMNQIILREAMSAPLLVVQSRTFGLRPDVPAPDADLLVTFSNGATTTQNLSPLQRGLMQSLDKTGMRTKFVDGSAETAGYELGYLPQSLYLAQSANKEFAVLWMSPLARAAYQQQTENRLMASQFNALRVPTQEMPLYQVVANTTLAPSTLIPEALRSKLDRYLKTQDIIVLSEVRSVWPGYEMKRLIDTDSKQAFLLLYAPDGKLALVVNLVPGKMEKSITAPLVNVKQTVVAEFVESHAPWLEFKGEK